MQNTNGSAHGTTDNSGGSSLNGGGNGQPFKTQAVEPLPFTPPPDAFPLDGGASSELLPTEGKRPHPHREGRVKALAVVLGMFAALILFVGVGLAVLQGYRTVNRKLDKLQAAQNEIEKTVSDTGNTTVQNTVKAVQDGNKELGDKVDHVKGVVVEAGRTLVEVRKAQDDAATTIQTVKDGVGEIQKTTKLHGKALNRLAELLDAETATPTGSQESSSDKVLPDGGQHGNAK